MESINRQSILENQKLISLKPLIEHIYLEDRRQAILEVATAVNTTITYQVKCRQRTQQPPKPPERRSALSSKSKHYSKDIPTVKRAIGTQVSVEFYNDSDCVSTTWHKGTVIRCNKQGYLVTFDDYGPDHNEVIKSLKKSFEKGEIKIL